MCSQRHSTKMHFFHTNAVLIRSCINKIGKIVWKVPAVFLWGLFVLLYFPQVYAEHNFLQVCLAWMYSWLENSEQCRQWKLFSPLEEILVLFCLIRKQSTWSFFQVFLFPSKKYSLSCNGPHWEHPELENSSPLCLRIIWEHAAN